jgi:protein involved in polysaccharide export with SLBB domain
MSGSARSFAAAFISLCLLASIAAQAETNPYTIHADDQLQVMVFGTEGVSSISSQGQSVPNTIPSLSQTVTVLSDGTITYPLIGSISVAGLRPEAAADRIAAALAVYVIHPTVSVLVVKGTPARIEVLGSVEHGGQFELEKGDRLVDALVKAGVGPSSFADLNHITINRVVNGTPALYNINLYNMLLNADYASNPVLEPGDIVYVPKAKQHDLTNLASIPFALYYLYLLAVPSAGAAVVR